MTTFTTDDREEAYKKIVAEAPNQPGYEDAVPIPFAGWVNTSPPHIVDSGASVMDKPVAWMASNELLFSVVEDDIHHIPLYTHPVKTLTDEEIWELAQPHGDLAWQDCTLEFARAILRKTQEK